MKINNLPTPQTQQSQAALQKASSSAKSQTESSPITSTRSVGEQNGNDQDDRLSLSLTGLSSLAQQPTTASELTDSQASDLAKRIKQDFQNNPQASNVFRKPDSKAVISLLSS
jgi:hypothetical protein